IFFNLVLQMINAFQTFTQAFIVSGGTGGPSDSTLFYTLYLYQKGFGAFDMGYASAMAWLLLMIIGGFTAVNFLAPTYWVFYGDLDVRTPRRGEDARRACPPPARPRRAVRLRAGHALPAAVDALPHLQTDRGDLPRPQPAARRQLHAGQLHRR